MDFIYYSKKDVWICGVLEDGETSFNLSMIKYDFIG